MPRFLELFAGAGGMTMGFEASGWECVGHAEIEPHARAILRHKWPEVPLHGDVAQLDGTTLPHFDLLTFGAPCQDLSIAGKRAGMTEGSGTRSSLFFEAIRIWKESSAPLALYENVLGAYSSNNGNDFAAVLSAFVGAAVPVPADGWRGAGVAAGPAGIAAWRTVDLQHFGWDGDTTPQRRRRVFVLGTRTGDYDPAEVLLVTDGLLGNLASSGEAGEGTAEDALASTHGPSGEVTYAFKSGQSEAAGGTFVTTDYVPTIQGQNNGSTAIPAVLRSDAVASVDGKVAYPIQNPGIVEKSQGGVGIGAANAPMYTLESRGHGVLTYDARGNGEGVTDNTLSGDHQNRVTDYTALVLRNREGKPGGGKGPLVSAERSLTLGTSNDQVVFPTISMGAHTAAPGSNGQDAIPIHDTMIRAGVGVPRRLLPVETEALMGWPRNHTAIGVDENGREYHLSDTARYRLVGNGVGSPVTAWIGMRLKVVLDNAQPSPHIPFTP
jgi:DNA (cytosine-5)-methyltransferase 1